MKDKSYRAVFLIVFATGVGFCIGGVWVKDLLVPGGALVTGAVAMYAQVILETLKNTIRRSSDAEPPTTMQTHPTTSASDPKPHKSSAMMFTKRLSWVDSTGHHTRTMSSTQEERVSIDETEDSNRSVYYSTAPADDEEAQRVSPRSPRRVLTVN